MIGELVPLVLIPRYTSFASPGNYTTVPLDVEVFAEAVLTLWRGPLVGSSPQFRMFIEKSEDCVSWFVYPPYPSTGNDPGANQSMPLGMVCDRRWLRVRINLTGTGAGVTCWCAGHMELRVS